SLDPSYGPAPVAGFTLIEMLVVITILALAASVAMPALTKPSDAVRLQASARAVINALRVSRAAAIAHNAEVTVVIDVQHRTIESAAVPRHSLGSDIAAKITFAEPERRGRNAGAFRFFPDGSATGGDVQLALAGREARICLDWLTGEARPC